MPPDVLIERWQQRKWRRRVARMSSLRPLHVTVKRRAENCEYNREGTATSRRAILREQVPTAVKMRRRERPRPPRAARSFPHCGLAGPEDTEHLLLKCPLYDGEGAQLFSAVRVCLAPKSWHGRGTRPCIRTGGWHWCWTGRLTACRLRRRTGATDGRYEVFGRFTGGNTLS